MNQTMKILSPGLEVGEYVLEERLGAGAFGQVWRARHHLFRDRIVALKIPHDPSAIADLAKEGVIQANLDHPGIVKAIGIDPNADPPYFSMEYVAGGNLRELLKKEGPLPAVRAKQILQDILLALEYAHDRGVIHQDIKPENVLVLPDGTIKITDFGLGMTLSGDSLAVSLSLKSEEGVRGTLAYIAPEIRDGEPNIDARADLYSLGVLACEMVTGKRPAGAELPSHIRPDVPTWCDTIVRKLYVRRENRLKDARAALAMLEDPTGKLKPRPAPSPPPPPARKPGPIVWTQAQREAVKNDDSQQSSWLILVLLATLGAMAAIVFMIDHAAA